MSRDIGLTRSGSGHVTCSRRGSQGQHSPVSVTQAAAEYGYSRRQLHRLLARYREGGLDAVEPRSRRPASNSAATPDAVRERIVQLRLQLSKDGLDAGPVTIAWHLEQEGHRPPSTSTIRRILTPRAWSSRNRETTPLLLPPLRRRPTQRVLAIGLHPLAPGRRHRRRDPELAR